jgi:hypothetical protein
MNSLRVQVALLFALVACAFALRVRGLGYQLPQWTYWDGYVLFEQTQHVRGELEDTGPRRTLGYYPYLTAAVASAMPPIGADRDHAHAVTELALHDARVPWQRIRLASVLLSLFAVVGAWGIARRFVTPPFALLAAALTATSLLHVTYSTAQRPHGAASGMAALALWWILEARRSERWSVRLLAIVGVGLAIAALQSGFATLVALAVACWLRRGRGSIQRNVAFALLALGVLALVVRVAYPFHFDGRAGATAVFEEGGEAIKLAGHTIHLSKLTGRGFWILASSCATFDPVLTLLAAFGIVLGAGALLRARDEAARERRRDVLVLLGYAAPYALVFGIYDLTFERFGLPLIPLLAVAAACAVSRIAAWLPAKLRGAPVGLAGFAIVLALPTFVVWKLGALRGAPDTFEVASQWLEEHAAPEGKRVFLLQNFDLPSLYSEASLREQPPNTTLYWTQYQRTNEVARLAPALDVVRAPRPVIDEEGEEIGEPAEVSLEWLREQGVRYVVALPASRGLRDKSALELVRALRRGERGVTVIAPVAGELVKGRKDQDLGFGVTESGSALNVLRAERAGPQIEIFQL